MTRARTIAALILFAALSALVAAGSTASLDRSLLLAFPRPSALDAECRALTFLGGNLFTIAIAIIAALAAFPRAKKAALLPPAAILGGLLLQNLLKWIFHRARPDLLPLGVDVSGYSYPSGHAMMSAISWFAVAALIAHLDRRRRATAFAAAALLTILIGLTRLYFAVHWPSDVLGGWLVGFAWCGIVSLIAGV